MLAAKGCVHLLKLFKDQILSLRFKSEKYLTPRVHDQGRASHAQLQAELDQLLAKVSDMGLDKLSAKERKRLSDIGKRLKE